MLLDTFPASGKFLWKSLYCLESSADTLYNSATTVWMGSLCVLGAVAGWLFKKYPVAAPDPDEVVAAEIQMQRERGLKVVGVDDLGKA
jgi:hypothetical protein